MVFEASIRVGVGWVSYILQEQVRRPHGGRGRHSPQAGSENGQAHQGRREGDPDQQLFLHSRRQGSAH